MPCHRTNLWWLSVWLSLSISLVPQAVLSEAVSIGGLSFPVDKLASVDENTLHVTVFGKEGIVARTNLEDHVFSAYASDLSRLEIFGIDNLIAFVEASAKEGAAQRAAAMLRLLCIRTQKDGSSARLLEFLQGLDSTAVFNTFFRSAGELLDGKHCSNEIAAHIVFRAGLADREWLRSRGIRWAFEYESALRRIVETHAYNAGLSHNFQEMGRLIDFYGTAFGQEDRRAMELRVLHGKISQAVDELKNGDVETLQSLLEASKNDPWLADIIAPLLVDALHARAAKALARSDADQALIILSHIDLKKRTPTTHELMRKGLESLKPSSRPVIGQVPVASALLTIAEVDPTVRQAYGAYLERLLDYLFAQGSLEEVNLYFQNLKALRPDPSRENDRIRIRQIRTYLDRGMLFSARDKLKRVSTGVPLFSRIRFALQGLYFDTAYLWIAVIAPVGAACVMLLISLIDRFRRREYEKKLKQREEEHEESETIAEPFVRSGLLRSLSPSMMEYRECLNVFGLTDGADLKTIKAAYRHAVKEVHPDLNRNLDERASERFIELTKTYERILELHAEVQPLISRQD